MSGLFGAIYGGVSGLKAQSSEFSTISQDISNSRTVGYKSVETQFKTLVVDAGSGGTTYSTGGVMPISRNLVDIQGNIESTDFTTDLAVSGSKGMFVVNTMPDGTGSTYYTRAGSFRADSLGNLRNAAGFYLMTWPLDSQGRLPGDTGNVNTVSSALQSSLVVANTNSLSGVAVATSVINLVGANLKADQITYAGAGETLSINSNSINNKFNGENDILIPNSNIDRGDGIEITADKVNYNFVYGGFDNSFDVTTMGTNGVLGVISQDAVIPFALDGNNFSITTAKAGTLEFTFRKNSYSTSLLQFNSLTTLAEAINSNEHLTARVVNNQLYIAPRDGREAMTFKTGGSGLGVSNDLSNIEAFGAADATTVFTTNATEGDGMTIEGLISGRSKAIGTGSSALFAATTTAGVFSGSTILDGDGIELFTSQGIKQIFTFRTTPVLPTDFNSMDTLAAAINTVSGLSASIPAVPGTQLFIKAINANDYLSKVIDINTVSSTNPSNIATVLGLTIPTKISQTVTFKTSAPTAGLGQFNNLSSLKDAINAGGLFSAAITGNVLSIAPLQPVLPATSLPSEQIITSISDFNNLGTSSFATTLGLIGADFVRGLGLINTSAQSNRFSTIGGLNNLINLESGIAATLTSPATNAQLKFIRPIL